MRQLVRGGGELDIPSREEIAGDLSRIVDDQLRAAARGIKWMRLPQLSATPASSAVAIGSQVAPVGPEQGYIWSLRRIVIDGMTAGASPDIVNMYRNASTGQPPLWQFNGNNFGYTFGKMEMILQPGDSLQFASVGTFAATGVIRVTGELVEVPAEMIAKML